MEKLNRAFENQIISSRGEISRNDEKSPMWKTTDGKTYGSQQNLTIRESYSSYLSKLPLAMVNGKMVTTAEIKFDRKNTIIKYRSGSLFRRLADQAKSDDEVKLVCEIGGDSLSWVNCKIRKAWELIFSAFLVFYTSKDLEILSSVTKSLKGMGTAPGFFKIWTFFENYFRNSIYYRL